MLTPEPRRAVLPPLHAKDDAPALAGADVWFLPLHHGDCVDAALKSVLPEDYAIAALAPRARRQRLVARGVLRSVLCSLLGTSAIALRHRPCVRCGNAHGKPAIDRDAVRFNVSHTDGAVLVAVARGEIGVDIERSRPDIRAESLSRRVLSGSERDWLLSHRPQDRAYAFTRLWVAKEAVLKAAGTGITQAALPQIGTIEQDFVNVAAVRRSFRVVPLPTPAPFVAAAAVEEPDAEVRLLGWSPERQRARYRLHRDPAGDAC